MPYCARCGKPVAEDARYCPNCGAPQRIKTESFVVSGEEIVDRVKQLIHEGNVTRIIVKSEKDKTLLDIPVTAGAVGTILFPWMAALGVIAALATRCKITVERAE